MKYILFFLVFIATNSFAQVGVNTATPSSAAVLHLESLNTETGAYGGFMLPVINLTQRDLIPVTAADDGLMIYLVNGTTRCLQIYSATANNWIDHCGSTTNTVQNVIQQDFDNNTCWTYISNLANIQDINNNGTHHGVTDGLPFPGLVLTNNFFALLDPESGSLGTSWEVYLVFNQINVSAITAATFSFDYDSNDFQDIGGDYFGYQVFHDGAPQGYVSLCDGCNNGSNGTVSVAIPDTVVYFYVVVTVRCNGDNDYVGFDNFLIQ